VSLKLSELIAAYGDDKVQFQNLDQCGKTLDYHHKKGTTITFGTEETIGANGLEKLGLVVWFDRERVAEIVAASKEPRP
jgi:hypothetical protein